MVETENPKNYGFSLNSLGKSVIFFCKSESERDKWIDSMKVFSKVLLRGLYQDYDMGKLLGTGGFSKVHIATHKKSKETFAVKSISKSKLKGNLKNLVPFLKKLNR